MVDYGPTNNEGYSHTLVVTNSFSNDGWTILLKNKNAKTMLDELSTVKKSSKCKLIQRDNGNEFVNRIFNEFLKRNVVERYSRYTSKGAVLAERFTGSIRTLIEKPVFENRNATWISELPSIIKKYNNTIHHSTEITPIQTSKKINKQYLPISRMKNKDVN